ncbi:MAG: acetyltransferase [Acidimicrobiaceae bacterium]|nr:acetyltransferase [Acidimicrobiaceae bacterium]
MLLSELSPVRLRGSYVFVSVAELPTGVVPVVTVAEDEGLTIVLERDEADRLGLPYAFVAAMITLRVRSALTAVGLTAAVASVLADAGISCNFFAGYFHDHMFVPEASADQALVVLTGLSEDARAPR